MSRQRVTVDEIQAAEVRRSGLSRRALLNGAGVAGAGTVAAAMAPGTAAAAGQAQVAAVTAARFTLEVPVNGGVVEDFAQLVEVVVEIEASEYMESGWPERHRLGRFSAAPKPVLVTVQRQLAAASSVWRWMATARTGLAQARSDVSLRMFDSAGTLVAEFELLGCFPLKHAIAGLKAGDSDVLIETLTLVADDITSTSAADSF